jgi:predicted nucleic acid-binding protein
MRDRIFLDTNFLVYTADIHNRAKQKKAQELFVRITIDDFPVISTQVLQEFYNTATKKLNMFPATAKTLVHNFSKRETITITSNIIEQAIDINIHNQISFWDSLIVAAAEMAHCSILLSEDLNDSQIIRGIKIINPFKN